MARSTFEIPEINREDRCRGVRELCSARRSKVSILYFDKALNFPRIPLARFSYFVVAFLLRIPRFRARFPVSMFEDTREWSSAALFLSLAPAFSRFPKETLTMRCRLQPRIINSITTTRARGASCPRKEEREKEREREREFKR